MRWSSGLSIALGALAGATIANDAATNSTDGWPLHSDGLSSTVEWDHYSLLVDGQRFFFFSGEFHYWRIPVPELWQDMLQKIKAAGFTGFSIYNNWAYHSAADGVLDWSTGAHDFTPIMELAKEVGLYMQIRPGPYINAETSGGGFPAWLLSGAYGKLRNNDTRYTGAWTPYFSQLSRMVAPYTVANGGNVLLFQIENEFEQWNNVTARTIDYPQSLYMAQLEQCALENGINIPLTANDGGMTAYSWSRDFSNAPGNVDIAGLDSYPSCWVCNVSECDSANGPYLPDHLQSYWPYFAANAPTQPSYFAEFQGGSNLVWGLPGGQRACDALSDADFANIVYRHNIANRVTAMSLYMIYGGTNWGYIGEPVATTTYDYSAAISENRLIGDKFYEMKLLAMFTRVAKDLPLTNFGKNGTDLTDNPAVLATELRNPETNAGFYVTVHAYSPSETDESFHLTVNTSAGILTVPQYGEMIALNGRQSKIIPTDFRYGSKNLLYSTAEIMTWLMIDGKEVLVLWVPTGEAGEFTIEGASSAEVVTCVGCADVQICPGKQDRVTIAFLQNEGLSIFELNDGSRVITMDRTTAYRAWVPSLGTNPLVSENETVLVQGPYLVRSAGLSQDSKTLDLTGDADESGTMTIVAPQSIAVVTWNGQNMGADRGAGETLLIRVGGPEPFKLPALENWMWHDSLPEIASSYDDTGKAWMVANHTNTTLPTKPAPNNPVLYPDDYGFHTGVSLYRARFSTSNKPAPTGVFLDLSGGNAFGYSAWLNGNYLGSWLGTFDLESQSSTFQFPSGALVSGPGKTNILLVVMDNTGHEEQAQMPPRGITNATLLYPPGSAGADFESWKIAGNAGGEANIDPMRGPLNEGGLYAERVGMTMPGYPDDDWELVPPSEATVSGAATTLSFPGTGIRVYRANLPLQSVPARHDVSVSFRLTAPVPSTSRTANQTVGFRSDEGYTDKLRALLFVNGYQFGKFFPYIGTQFDFPVPPGVLDYSGDNTIALTLWSQSEKGVAVRVEPVLEYVHTSGYDFGFDSAYLRPGWTEGRLEYA